MLVSLSPLFASRKATSHHQSHTPTCHDHIVPSASHAQSLPPLRRTRQRRKKFCSPIPPAQALCPTAQYNKFEYSRMAEIMDAYWRAPPLARTFASAVLVTSIGCHFGIIPIRWFYFHYLEIFKLPPEIWRVITSFLLTGPGLAIIMDTYFVFQYLSQLETAHPKFNRREDLVWYLVVCGVTILVLAQYFLGEIFFLPALILSMAYTATQDARGQKAGFFFFTVPAQLIPLCMMGATLLMAGPQAMLLQLTGLIAAHLHDFLTRIYPEFGGGRNWIATPAFLSRMVTTPRILQRNYGTGIRPTQSSGSTTGAQPSGPLPDSWRNRGTGHRLG